MEMSERNKEARVSILEIDHNENVTPCPVLNETERAEALSAIPGPSRMPIFGNALQMEEDSQHLWFEKLAMDHGPVMRVKLYESENIILSSMDVVNEAMTTRGSECMGARQQRRLQAYVGESLIASNASSQHYTVIREAVTTGLQQTIKQQDFKSRQRQMYVDVAESCYQSRVFNVAEKIKEWITRSATQLVLGGLDDVEDEKCKAFSELEGIISKMLSDDTTAILDMKPNLFEYKLLKPTFHHTMEEDVAKLDEICKRQIAVLRANFEGDKQRCVMDYLLKKQYDEIKDGGDVIVNDEKMASNIKELSLHSYTTWYITVVQAIHILITDRELQQRLQKQIDSRFSQDYVIMYSDREKLSLIEAFIMENYRYCPALPFLIPHAAESDTVIGGFKIPKGSSIWWNYYTTTRNPDIYEDPATFSIDRFIGSGGQLVAADHPARLSVNPFGLGMRQCPGREFFMQYFFEMLCYTLQHYTIEAVGNEPVTDIRNMSCGLRNVKLSADSKAKFNKRPRM